MKHLIIQASEILEDKFKIKPEKSKLYIHEDIQKLINRTRNKKAQSIFFPRDLSAHVSKGRLDLILHEYHGHGLYCEQTHYGKKMVEDENNIKNMPQEEVQKALTLHEYVKPNFEGHALWTEDFLLTSLNKLDLLESRLIELESLDFHSQFHLDLKTQKDVYDRIKQFELEKGIYDMWYSLGFPRQFDKNTLTEIAHEKLNSRFNNIIFLIHFGSKNPEGDIDLCAVLDDTAKLDEYEDSRTIDLVQYNYSDFLRRMKLFDLVITHPILTGELIFGDKNVFERLKITLNKQKPTDEAITYLKERSRWCLDYAIECFNESDKYVNALDLTLNNLSHALSYNEASMIYSQRKFVILLDELENTLSREIRAYMKSSKIRTEKLNKTKEFIDKARKEIN